MSGLKDIYLKKEGSRKRISSYDKTGGNDDRFHIAPGEEIAFAQIEGSGIIEHIWITTMSDGIEQDPFLYRNVYLQFFWDDEENPSVQAPLGDFFGMGHAMHKNFSSAPLQMAPEDGKALNSWWPMPFRKGARLVVKNESPKTLLFYFYVDYVEKEVEEETLYFHALWHRECPTVGRPETEFKDHADWCFGGINKTGEDNFVILETTGKGHYCGCNINIHNLNTTNLWDWPGEGDDMIFIDGDTKPTLHGTGTEDYVNMAWCPQQEFNGPYHGLILGGDENWKGKITYYRYHILDPILFNKEIKVTIEHGNANVRSDDWCTTAYWYQTEPHKKVAPILPKDERMPVDSEHLRWMNEVKLIKQ